MQNKFPITSESTGLSKKQFKSFDELFDEYGFNTGIQVFDAINRIMLRQELECLMRLEDLINDKRI